MEIVDVPDCTAVVEALRNHHVDIGFMSGFPSALAVSTGEGDSPVARPGSYARTGENSDAIMERISPLIGPLMAWLGMDLDAAARAASTGRGFSTAPMQGLIAEMTERHGDPLAPLRAAGLSDALVERLRERAIAR